MQAKMYYRRAIDLAEALAKVQCRLHSAALQPPQLHLVLLPAPSHMGHKCVEKLHGHLHCCFPTLDERDVECGFHLRNCRSLGRKAHGADER